MSEDIDKRIAEIELYYENWDMGEKEIRWLLSQLKAHREVLKKIYKMLSVAENNVWRIEDELGATKAINDIGKLLIGGEGK